MIAASVIAAMKMSALLSYQVWARLQSLSLANMFSTLWRCLYCILQKVVGELRRRLGALQGVMPLACRAPRRQNRSLDLRSSPAPWPVW